MTYKLIYTLYILFTEVENYSFKIIPLKRNNLSPFKKRNNKSFSFFLRNCFILSSIYISAHGVIFEKTNQSVISHFET